MMLYILNLILISIIIFNVYNVIEGIEYMNNYDIYKTILTRDRIIFTMGAAFGMIIYAIIDNFYM